MTTSDHDAADLRAAIEDALRQVYDPELGENLVDLGIVDDISIDADRVTVRLLPTSATCPMTDIMVDDAAAAVQRVCPETFTVDVDVDWDATWSPARMSATLRERFGW